jgi:hypothetical protein
MRRGGDRDAKKAAVARMGLVLVNRHFDRSI